VTDTRIANEVWRGQTVLDGRALPRSRRRGPGCLSDLQLDQLQLGELSPEARGVSERHLAGCPSCAQAHSALATLAATFAGETDVPSLAARTLDAAAQKRTPPWRRWLMPVSLSAAAALGATLLLVRPPLPETGTRTKGGFSLNTYVQHAESDAPARLHLGEPLHPGDRVQFRYQGNEAGYLMILSADQAGRVSVYYPPGDAAAPVAAGRDVPLATAIELDDTLGDETVVALRCATAVSVAQAQEALAKAAAPTSLRLGCAEHRVRLTKVATPAASKPR
jgi:hypothetical protein